MEPLETNTPGAGSALIQAGMPASEAVSRLAELHGGRLYRLGRRLCGGEDEAQDLTQEVFLNAFRKWHQFDGRSDPTSWLYTIAVRACRRRHRRRAGEPRHFAPIEGLLPEGDAPLPEFPAQDDPAASLLRSEARAVVERALVQLPLPYRLPLVLHELAELPLETVAAVMGLKLATVKTRIHRGRLLLRKELDGILPRRVRPAPPSPSREICLDLLQAKQEALDRGVPLPLDREGVCERCKALFATLDLAQETCRDLARGELPPALRRLLAERFAAEKPA